MTLEEQFIAMGMTPEQAKEHAKNFVTGLKELGLSDNEPKDFVQAAKQSTKIASVLAKVGVRPQFIQTYGSALEKAMVEFGITTRRSQAMFLSQVLHESAMLSAVIENLNYSELGLVKTFKKYFDRNSAKRYARNPQKIANRVYANRMGNGSEDSGDGWRYRGRGLIQLTGKDNYVACGKDLKVDLIKNPDYLTTPEGAARSAGWFWRKNKLSFTAERGDIVGNTKIINGGTKGLEHRTQLYNKLLPLF